MSLPWIVQGDSTSHGGKVIEGNPTFTTHGKPVAQVGHMVTCPKCKGGPFPIVSGAPDFIANGKPVARHGDKVACGATLISSQVVSRYSSESSSNLRGGSKSASALAAPIEDSSTEHFYSLVDDGGIPVEGYHYDLHCEGQLHTKAGSFSEGETTTIMGDKATRLVAWLARDGGLRS